MKKLLFIGAMLGMSMASQAQVAYEKANFWDNWYVGVKAGASTPLNFDRVFPLNAGAALKVGKNFSPMFGANFEGFTGFGNNVLATKDPWMLNSHTFVKALNLGLNGTWNLTNTFCEYNPDRTFEVGVEAGVGFTLVFGDPYLNSHQNYGDDDELTAKTGLTFAWNLGEKKAWQLYLEPTVMWNLTNGPGDAVQFNKQFAQLGLFAGVNYKFKTSNETHNFKVWNLDDMNAEINNLRAQLDAKPKEVVREVVKEVVKEVPSNTVQTLSVDNLVFVTFQQGKSILTKQAKQALDVVKSGKHVQIVGTASPEGPKDLNDRLSQARADVVAEYLKGKGVIVDEATGKGVQGVTSNRLAVVYVK